MKQKEIVKILKIINNSFLTFKYLEDCHFDTQVLAERLGICYSTITHQILHAERLLGCQLVTRGRHKNFTKEGRLFMRKIRQLDKIYDSIEEMIIKNNQESHETE